MVDERRVDEPVAEVEEDRTYGDPNAKSVAYVTLIGTIVLVEVILLLQALYYRADFEQTQNKVVDTVPIEVTELYRAKREALASYGVEAEFEEGRTRVAIPIERAMELLAERARDGEIAAAAPTIGNDRRDAPAARQGDESTP